MGQMANKKIQKHGKRKAKSTVKNITRQKKNIVKGRVEVDGLNVAIVDEKETLCPGLADHQSPPRTNEYVPKRAHRELTGRRIVSIDTLQNLLTKTEKHAKECHRSELQIVKETNVGLLSRFHLKCKNCSIEISVSSDSKNDSLPINQAVVWGTVEGGGGYESLFDFLKIIDIPPMDFRRYKSTELLIHEYQKNSLVKNLIQNGEEELRLALKDKETTYINGVPCITVSCDGGWGKRSYGHSYKSLSGCAAIIGNKTGKLLYVGVRNKYCYTCDVHPKSPHQCFKNYKGSSTSMETDIILQGFLSSKEMNGTYYNKMLADQDSSVFVTVQEAMQMKYGITVEKINCVNHAIRCLKTNLYKMAGQTKTYSEKSRSWLKGKIVKFGTAIRCAIKYNHQNDIKDSNWKTLRQDILNTPEHYIENHDKCRKYFCRKNSATNAIVKNDTKFWKDLVIIFNRLANLAQSLIQNQRTNKAESFMGIVSKYIGGKRKNFYLRNQYQTRIYFATNSHKKKHQSLRLNYKSIFGKSPLSYWSLKGLRHRGRRPRERKYKSIKKQADVDYGDEAQAEDMSFEVFQIECEKYLNLKKITIEKQQEIMRATTGQSSNEKWFECRTEILTASKFYVIIRKQKKTKIGNLVKSVLYSGKEIWDINKLDYINDPRAYGLYYENQARRLYELVFHKTTTECGLLIDIPNGLIGASPDALIDSNGLLEIKCPFKARFYDDINKAIQEGAIPYLRISDGKPQLVRNSAYYFQVIGQLGVTNREYCDFFVFIPNAKTNNYFCERIFKNSELWNLVKPELERFYNLCLLPEIIDPRLRRKREIREFEFCVNDRLQTFRKSLGRGVTNTTARKRKVAIELSVTPKKKAKQVKGKVLFDS